MHPKKKLVQGNLTGTKLYFCTHMSSSRTNKFFLEGKYVKKNTRSPKKLKGIFKKFRGQYVKYI